MPLHRGKSKDTRGVERPYYSWGKHGKKYHYDAGNKRSRDTAKSKALRQGRATHARGYRRNMRRRRIF